TAGRDSGLGLGGWPVPRVGHHYRWWTQPIPRQGYRHRSKYRGADKRRHDRQPPPTTSVTRPDGWAGWAVLMRAGEVRCWDNALAVGGVGFGVWAGHRADSSICMEVCRPFTGGGGSMGRGCGVRAVGSVGWSLRGEVENRGGEGDATVGGVVE